MQYPADYNAAAAPVDPGHRRICVEIRFSPVTTPVNTRNLEAHEKTGVSVFQRATLVATTPEALFAFHADPGNITEVMPPTLKLVKLVTDGPAMEGRLIELQCRDWGIIPLRWLCRWKRVAPPNLLVDEIIRGPFRLFIHEHRFDAAGDGLTRMTDRVTYAWGRSWWGRLVSETGVRGYLTLLFGYRHYRTRRWARAMKQRA